MAEPIDPAEFRKRADAVLVAITRLGAAHAARHRATADLKMAEAAEAEALNAFAAYVGRHAGFLDVRLFGPLGDRANG